jgi:hypothetical protein
VAQSERRNSSSRLRRRRRGICRWSGCRQSAWLPSRELHERREWWLQDARARWIDSAAQLPSQSSAAGGRRVRLRRANVSDDVAFDFCDCSERGLRDGLRIARAHLANVVAISREVARDGDGVQQLHQGEGQSSCSRDGIRCRESCACLNSR